MKEMQHANRYIYSQACRFSQDVLLAKWWTNQVISDVSTNTHSEKSGVTYVVRAQDSNPRLPDYEAEAWRNVLYITANYVCHLCHRYLSDTIERLNWRLATENRRGSGPDP